MALNNRTSLSDRLVGVLEPLIHSNILKIRQNNGLYEVERIEGTFNYEQTRKMLFDCLSITRNYLSDLSKRSYLFHLKNRRLLKELDEGVFLFDKVLQAFLQALAISEQDLNTKMRWNFEIGFLSRSHLLVASAASSFHQRLNEQHVLATVVIATAALLTSVVALFL